MKTNLRKSKTIATISLIVLVASLVAVGIYHRHNKGLKTTVETEKIKSEALLSETLQLKKSLEDLRVNVIQLKESNNTLDMRLTEKINLLKQKEAEVNRLFSENASLKQFRQKTAELEQVRDQLSKELSSLMLQMDGLRSENSDLSNQLARAKSENSSLNNDNSQLLSALLANNYRMEATKGKNQRLTLNARRTDKLVVSFDLPVAVDKNLHFNVITPAGEQVSSLENSDFLDLRASEVLYASLDDNFPEQKNVTRRIEMTYKPSVKLTKGIYQFDIFSKDTYIGSTQIRLK